MRRNVHTHACDLNKHHFVFYIDFDQRVMKYFIDQMKKKNKVDISKDKRALQKLRKEVERVKRALSSQQQARLEVEELAEGFDLPETTATVRRFAFAFRAGQPPFSFI